MAFIYIIFEFFTIAIFLGLIIHSLRKRKAAELAVVILSAATVTSGELINSFVSKVTVYNSSFLLWIPKTGIPVFIICGGIAVSLILFIVADRFSSKGIFRKSGVVMILSLLFPLIELAGMGSGLWKWPGNPQVNTSWIIGVWEFYMIFIGLPALIGCFVSGSFLKAERG